MPFIVEQCHSCRAVLPEGGRKPTVSSRRYCSARKCQTARQRHYRSMQRLNQPEPPNEVRPCFNCGKVLPARSGRFTDSPVGRWCKAAVCQRDRVARLLLHSVVDAMKNGDPVQMTVTEMALLSARLMRQRSEKGRVPCDACGRLDAIRDYPHPTPDRSDICRALGNHASLRADNDFFFPATIE